MRISRFFLLALTLLALVGSAAYAATPQRIVSLDGAATEILFDLGVGERIVGRDVTSYYPEAATKIPLVGREHTISAEGVLSLKPDLIIISEYAARSPGLTDALKTAKVRVVTLPVQDNVDGARAKIKVLAAAVDRQAQGEKILASLNQDLEILAGKVAASKTDGKPAPRAAFIYLRSAQHIFLCGKGSRTDAMMTLAGAADAVTGIEDCKPLSAEALVKANPDVVVLFEKGLASVGGLEGLKKVPGIRQTKAAREERFVILDDLYLGGFGPRTGKAGLDLFNGLHQAKGVYEGGKRS